MKAPMPNDRREELLRRLADALARVAQEHGEDVDSDRLLAPPTEETPPGERRVQ